jgi:hypothetical protein
VKRFVLLMLMIGLLVACNTLDQQEIDATLSSGDAVLGTEAAIINATAVVERAEVGATIAANQTQIADARYINRMIGATLDAGSTPTPDLRVGAVPMPDFEHLYGPNDIAPFWPGVIAPQVEGYPTLESGLLIAQAPPQNLGDARFLFTGLTSILDDDGCVMNPRTTFFADRDGLIFYTLRLQNVPANTRLLIEWEYEGTVRVREGWDTPGYSADACARIALSSSTTQFTSGNWAAYLYVGNVLVADPAQFVIRPE